MPEFNLIKLEGKPFEKLIDVISKGIGTIYKPRAIKKEADSKAYEIQVIEQAKSKALAEGKKIEAETYIRIQERILFNEKERQKSIDNVVEIAAAQLKSESHISDEPVDKDWSKRFFNIVQDISDNEMQTLWGRILAGETKQPNSYSKRTLELLKNLSRQEAETFTKFAELRIVSGDVNFIFNNDNGSFLKKEFGILMKDILLMSELGLIISETNLGLDFPPTKNKKHTTFLELGKKGIALLRNENTPNQKFRALIFSKSGIELSKLVEQNPSEKYIKEICPSFNHTNVTVFYGDLIKSSDEIRLENEIEFKK